MGVGWASAQSSDGVRAGDSRGLCQLSIDRTCSGQLHLTTFGATWRMWVVPVACALALTLSRGPAAVLINWARAQPSHCDDAGDGRGLCQPPWALKLFPCRNSAFESVLFDIARNAGK